MHKPLFIILFYVFTALLFFQNCSNALKPNVISGKDIIGVWKEADTSMGSEGWSFRDTTATHGFKGIDTIGQYPAWKISNDTIILTNQENKNEILLFKIFNNNKLNLKYYRWNDFIDKDFYKE